MLGFMSEPSSLLKTINFRFDENNIKLTADVLPLVDSLLPEAADIQQLLAAEGLAELYFFEGALDKLLKAVNETTEPVSIEIAERRNAGYLLTVAEDSMQASLTIAPAMGGEPVSQEALEEALQTAGITSGLLRDALADAVATAVADNLVIAVGTPAVDGVDTRFEVLYEESIERRPEINEKGRANYHALGNIATVLPGDPVMRRHPPIEGIAGSDVHGKTIPPLVGENIPFATGMREVQIDDNDPDLLCSTIAGHPVGFDHGVNVDHLYTIDNADLSTGNIDFDGSILINHDVRQGVSIKAAGDIFIHGGVEEANIEAGGDIEIAGGIIGHVEHHEDHSARPWSTHILAKKSIRALFAENAVLAAGKKIIVVEDVTRSDLRAEDSIIVGIEGCKKGYILGGELRANNNIQAIVAGSPSSIKTRLFVGYRIPDISSDINKLLKEIQLKEELLAKLEELIRRVSSGLMPNTSDLLEQAKGNIDAVNKAITERKNKIARLEKELATLHQATIDISKRAYINVFGYIGSESHRIPDETIGGQFRLEENKVIFSHADSSKTPISPTEIEAK